MRRCHLAIEHDLGGAPVDLSLLTRVKGQGHEDRALLTFKVANDMAHGGLGTGEAMLVAQETPDAVGRAALLAWLLGILGEPLADQGQHGVARKAEFAGDAALRPALHMMQSSDNVFVDHLDHLVVPPVD